jgi:hypothetical protein
MTALSYSSPPLRSHPHDIPIIRYCRSDYPINNELDKNSQLTFLLETAFFLSFSFATAHTQPAAAASLKFLILIFFLKYQSREKERKKEWKKPELESSTPRHDLITTCK